MASGDAQQGERANANRVDAVGDRNRSSPEYTTKHFAGRTSSHATWNPFSGLAAADFA